MEAARQDVRQKDLLLRAHSSSSPRSEAKEPDVVTQKDLQVQGDSSSPPRRETKPDAVLSDLHVEADASSPRESDRRTSIVRCALLSCADSEICFALSPASRIGFNR